MGPGDFVFPEDKNRDTTQTCKITDAIFHFAKIRMKLIHYSEIASPPQRALTPLLFFTVGTSVLKGLSPFSDSLLLILGLMFPRSPEGPQDCFPPLISHGFIPDETVTTLGQK